ncbi:MAG: hypothetical protein J2P17_25650, partial [Mycobacterium sp.]|nr:hypothetical protein [Mycobacterium sp.]
PSSRRDVVRHIQVLRRESGLEVSDRISLGLDTEAAEIRRAIDRFSETISSEVLAIGELSKTITGENVFTKTVKVSDKEITITLRAA